MDHGSQESFAARAVRLSHSAPAFARMADGTLKRWRAALGVPDVAEPEVEQELAALRASFDAQFLPDFARAYAALFLQHVGADGASVLDALEEPAVQAYLARIESIEADLSKLLRQHVAAMKAELAAAQHDR